MADSFTVNSAGQRIASQSAATQSAYGSAGTKVTHTTDEKASMALDMTDFLQLMVATFQNQTMDNTADIGDMMNQMVQMSVVQTITNLNSLITNTANMSYAASLVGKDVTVLRTSGRDTEQIQGTVTGTGTVDGQQMVFLGNDSYALSDIIAVGRMPENTDE